MKNRMSPGVKFLGTSFTMVMFLLALIDSIWAFNGMNNKYMSGELLIKTKAGAPREMLARAFEELEATVAGELSQIRVKRIKVPVHALEKVKIALENNPHVSFVEYNFIAEGSLTPNDEYYPSQWHHGKIFASQGWDITTGSNNVVLAIIDSGIDPSHPDLSDKLVAGYNFLEENTDTDDVLGHGTAVAGAAAALSNNLAGVAGVAWDNPVMPLVVLNSDNWASYYDIARAITYAADNGAMVINISIGGSSPSSTLQNAVDYAWNKGAIIFACAQNYSTDTPYYPAACNNVVAVSATTSDDSLAGFSNYGDWIDISAPGVSILTTTRGGGYSSWSGTSFSSPLSAGLAALILSANLSLTNSQVDTLIKENVDDIGPDGYDPFFGSGRINVYESLVAAVDILPEPDTTEPSVTITYPHEDSTVSGSLTVSVSATDNVGVTDVDLFINGIFYASDTSEPYDFFWNTENDSDGTYELVAYAYDKAGNMGQSNSVKILVENQTPDDTIAPTVVIKSPKNGAYVKRNVKVRGQAYDNVGITQVELYVDGILESITHKNHFTFVWKTQKASKGEHVISVKVLDGAGNIGIDSVTVYK